MDKMTAGRGGLGWDATHVTPAIVGLGNQLQEGGPGASQEKGLVTVTCRQLVELLREVGSSIGHTVETARS